MTRTPSQLGPLNVIGRMYLAAIVAVLDATVVGATERSQTFDADAAWDALRNHVVPSPAPTVTQNFGFSNTANAGGAAGELGGSIARTTTPAWYADSFSTPKTFNDVLSASGKISVSNQSTDGNVFFGWFNSARQGWRPWSSIDFRLSGQGTYSNVLIDYNTQTWKALGSDPSTTYRIQHDNSQHTWQLQYDPAANSSGGAISFTLDSLAPLVLNLAAGNKAAGASFDRFGMWNGQSPAGDVIAPSVSSRSVYFDDVQHDGGAVQTFANANTGWDVHGNTATFQDKELRQAHNFGWSNTNHAGGAQPGEVGGMIWRTGVHRETYYAAPTDQNLTLNNRLTASGKVALLRAQSDGGMYLGWFNKSSIENTVENPAGSGKAPVANFLAIEIEGPSREGHYFRPVFATADANQRDSGSGPVIFPDEQPHDFTILYDPAANSGLGKITVTLDSLSKEFKLTSSDRSVGATFDHFGIFSVSPDGNFVEPYFDDLVYTVGVPEPAAGGMIMLGLLAMRRRRRRGSSRDPDNTVTSPP